MLFFKKIKLSTPLFIASSLAVIILLPFLLNIFKSLLIIDNSQTDNQYFKIAASKDNGSSDPLITQTADFKPTLKFPIISADDPSLGPDNAPVAIVTFSDFKCAFCQKQELALKRLANEYVGKIRLIWKDYPENNQGSVSWKAALAARCAQEQNKFWPYHDLLYQQNGNLALNQFTGLARRLNLNEQTFKECLVDRNGLVRAKINNNIAEANILNINGVPFIYVNNKEIMGETSYEELKKIIDMELSKK